jgi:hypothetical protein
MAAAGSGESTKTKDGGNMRKYEVGELEEVESPKMWKM